MTINKFYPGNQPTLKAGTIFWFRLFYLSKLKRVVILSGGEAGARDLTTDDAVDTVDRRALGACFMVAPVG